MSSHTGPGETKKRQPRPEVYKLAEIGKSPVQCKDCRYRHPKKYRKIAGDQLYELRCYKRKLGKIFNPGKLHQLDPLYACGYGLPKKPEKDKKDQPAPEAKTEEAKA